MDAALKYLRFLSAYPEYGWLGSRPVRVLLMPLDFPSPPPEPPQGSLGCLRSALLSWREGEHQKLIAVMRQQALVQRIGAEANAAIRGAAGTGGATARQAILADFDLITPARKVYPGSWSFKRWLGFSPESQLELMAGGCRRARYALKFREWREGRAEQDRPTALELFDEEVRLEERTWRDRPGEHCVLGRFNPGPCGFLAIDPVTGAQIRRACVRSCLSDLPPGELPSTNRVDLWERLNKPT